MARALAVPRLKVAILSHQACAIDAPCARQHDDFAGGGGAGGSVSIIAGSLLGGGRVEAQGEHE
jgi:hypothetical protein